MISLYFILLFGIPLGSGKPTFYHVGIFSICTNQTANQTIMHRDGKIFDKWLEFEVKNIMKFYRESWFNVEYKSFNICDDFDKLKQIINTFLLGTEYTLDYGNISYSNVVLIWTLIPEFMARYVTDMFYFTSTHVRVTKEVYANSASISIEKNLLSG